MKNLQVEPVTEPIRAHRPDPVKIKTNEADPIDWEFEDEIMTADNERYLNHLDQYLKEGLRS